MPRPGRRDHLDRAAVLLHRAVDHRQPEPGARSPTGLVVKNGSKIARAARPRSCRAPVSLTAITTSGPAAAGPGRVRPAWPSSGSTSIASMPPSGIASRAFAARFSSTCSSCPWSTSTRQGSSARRGCAARRPRRSCAPASSRTPSTTARRSSTRGAITCCRLKASSWCVSAAARQAALSVSISQRCGARPRADVAQRQRQAAGDRRQQVVEVVRDAAREPADRLHLLRLPQPHLERRGARPRPGDARSRRAGSSGTGRPACGASSSRPAHARRPCARARARSRRPGPGRRGRSGSGARARSAGSNSVSITRPSSSSRE